MVGALITFAVLFGAIRLFERGRDDLEAFNVAVVVLVPVIANVLAFWVLSLFVPSQAIQALVPLILLITLTFFLLWKNLEISAPRSAAYTLVVLATNVGLVFVFGV